MGKKLRKIFLVQYYVSHPNAAILNSFFGDRTISLFTPIKLFEVAQKFN
jgi:hypothetical protein